MRRRAAPATAPDLPPLPDLGDRPTCSASPSTGPRICSNCPAVTSYNARLAEFHTTLADWNGPAVDHDHDIAQYLRAAGRRVLCWARI